MAMLDDYLDYVQEDNVKEGEPVSEVGVALIAGMPPLAVAAAAFSIFFTLVKGYQTYLSKAARACDGIVDPQLKNRCMVDYKLKGAKDFKTKLQGTKSKCKGHDGCENKFDRKLKALDTKIDKYTNQLRIVNQSKNR